MSDKPKVEENLGRPGKLAFPLKMSGYILFAESLEFFWKIDSQKKQAEYLLTIGKTISFSNKILSHWQLAKL